MTVSLKTAKMIWGKAAARCSMPNCRKELVLDETETDDPALIGDIAHMVAESEDGPRGASPLTIDQRNRYSNLLLLCKNDHREIDEQPNDWPIARLEKIKADHEAWVGSLSDFDPQRIRDDVVYAGYIDEWEKLCHLDTWTSWSGWVLSHGQPSLEKRIHDDLGEVVRWTMKRVWPGRYEKLEQAMRNFSLIARDFLRKFNEHSEPSGIDEDEFITRKFYQITNWDEDRYELLLERYNFHVDLVEDLMLELTRAANLVSDHIRSDVLHTYRLKEGRLSVMSGPHEDMSWRESVVEYSASERASWPPYPGLPSFLTVRSDRDWHFGVGLDPTKSQ